MRLPLTEVPENERVLRDAIIDEVAQKLHRQYSARERLRFMAPEFDAERVSLRVGAGSAAWPAIEWALTAFEEAVLPGYIGASNRPARGEATLREDLVRLSDGLYGILASFFLIEFEETRACRYAAQAAMELIKRLPLVRERAEWNIFASLKDPAVWDSFITRNEKRQDELSGLKLLPEIDTAIRARDRTRYVAFLREHGFNYAFDYQMRLVKRAYPGWRALLLHDFAHILAGGTLGVERMGDAPPAPFLPRKISEYTAQLYQADIHPETQFGDGNFIDHPHRGMTTGQTGKIGIGCVIYPCTLGGVTDNVKIRHPQIGDFVLIGTDVGIFGLVEIDEGTVVGVNSEIYGFVRIGKCVRIGSSVIAQTVRSGAGGRPGRLVVGDGAQIGDRALIVNDQPCDLVIPAGAVIPPHSHIINDGQGSPIPRRP